MRHSPVLLQNRMIPDPENRSLFGGSGITLLREQQILCRGVPVLLDFVPVQIQGRILVRHGPDFILSVVVVVQVHQTGAVLVESPTGPDHPHGVFELDQPGRPGGELLGPVSPSRGVVVHPTDLGDPGRKESSIALVNLHPSSLAARNELESREGA